MLRTPVVLNWWGQVIVLILIQIGGLGIMTLTFFVMRLAPGNPFASERQLSAVIQQNLNRRFGLDRRVAGWVCWVGSRRGSTNDTGRRGVGRRSAGQGWGGVGGVGRGGVRGDGREVAFVVAGDREP